MGSIQMGSLPFLLLGLMAMPASASAAPKVPPTAPPKKPPAADAKEASPPVEAPPPKTSKRTPPTTKAGAAKPENSYGTPRIVGKARVVPTRVCALYEVGAIGAAKAKVGLDATCKCAATKDVCKRNWRGAKKRWHDCTCDKPPRCDVEVCSRVQAFAVGKALIACKKPSCSCHRVERRTCGQPAAGAKADKSKSAEGVGAKKKKRPRPPAWVFRCDCP